MSSDNDSDTVIDDLVDALPPEEREKMRKKVEDMRRDFRERGRLFHQQLTLLYGTAGAICFAGLVLVIQDPRPFEQNGFDFLTPHQNFDLLALVLSIAIVLALVSSLPTSLAAAGIVKTLGPVGKFGYISGLVAIAFLIGGVVLMIGAITPAGTIPFMIMLLIILLIFVVALVKETGWRSLFPVSKR